MKVKRVIPMALVLMFTFIFYGMVFGEGSGPPPIKCEDLPDPKTAKGPLLQGFFTAAKDKGVDHFGLHILLEGEIPKDPKSPIIPTLRRGDQPKIRRLFYIEIGPVQHEDVCKRSDETLMNQYCWVPYHLKVQKSFNLEGTPVVKEVTVERQEFCDDPPGGKRMIYGTVKIIVVPPAAPKKK
jgi:hypothetical protein